MVSRTHKLQSVEIETTYSLPARARLLPALGLFFLAPLVGEFLLGNLPITWLWVLITLAPLYGGGALLVREVARRLKLGWPGLIALALAYAVIEEAFVTQTLFNPDYLGLRLLDYGYIPVLGIGTWWTVFVLSIHTVWSIAVPIALVENLSPQVRHTPWLGRLGLVITMLVFLAGCFLTYSQQASFTASNFQRFTSAVIVLGLIIFAIRLGRIITNEPKTGRAPTVLQTGGAAFTLGSAFMTLAIAHAAIPVILNVGGILAILFTGAVLLWRASQCSGWKEPHRAAVAGGLLLTYTWYGFVQVPSVETVSPLVDTLGNLAFAVAAIGLLFIAGNRSWLPD